jgi:MFS family permease
MMALVGLLAFNFSVILPVLASDTFHGTGGTYRLLTTMLSIGSVAGSLGVGLIGHPRRKYLVFTALAFGICLAATAASPQCRGRLRDAARDRSGRVLVRDAGLDHAAAALRARLPRPDHGAVGVRLHRDHPGWQHHHRRDQLRGRPTGPPC